MKLHVEKSFKNCQSLTFSHFNLFCEIISPQKTQKPLQQMILSLISVQKVLRWKSEFGKIFKIYIFSQDEIFNILLLEKRNDQKTQLELMVLRKKTPRAYNL